MLAKADTIREQFIAWYSQAVDMGSVLSLLDMPLHALHVDGLRSSCSLSGFVFRTILGQIQDRVYFDFANDALIAFGDRIASAPCVSACKHQTPGAILELTYIIFTNAKRIWHQVPWIAAWHCAVMYSVWYL